MADVLAIVSKAVFEKAAGKAPVLGAKLRMDRYVSANKQLAPLAGGGRLFLVTVRPPNEALWLVAILDAPVFDGTQWLAKSSQLPITDITALRDQLKFESGKGITAAPGALGMSLQTPRVLTGADVALLTGAELVAEPTEIGKLQTSNLSRKQALLQAVLDDPDADLPRQVFADERTLHHDPRGELILLDLALAGRLSIRKRALLAARRKELLAEHGATWFPYTLGDARRRAEFLAGVRGTLAQLTGAASNALFANEPVVDVTVTHVEGAEGAQQLARAPWLPRVRQLTVRGELGDDGFAVLVAAPGAQHLRSLNVIANEISSLAALGAHLPSCQVLALTSNPVRDAGLAQLARWQHLAQLETLYLSRCGITSVGLAALLAAPMPGLHKLTLSDNRLDDEGATLIAANARRVPNLAIVELRKADLSDAAVAAMTTAKLPHLRRIDVRMNGIRRSSDPRVRGDR